MNSGNQWFWTMEVTPGYEGGFSSELRLEDWRLRTQSVETISLETVSLNSSLKK